MLKTPLIPSQQKFYNATSHELVDFKFDSAFTLDKEAICFFMATGFFLDDTTHYKEMKVLKPATAMTMDGNKIVEAKNYWEWHYSPRDINLKQATEEFAHLFEKITREQLKGKKVIMPLSGGLDSRSQAAALTEDQDVYSYSYKFDGGLEESGYGKAIAQAKGFAFEDFSIKQSYLWENIDRLSDINQCFSEFTHPRQMAIFNEYARMGDVFYLGHWGDVLFDNDGIANDKVSNEQLIALITKKVIKKGGLDLAQRLWQAWELPGSFENALKNRLLSLLDEIKIDNVNARLRAFKSLHWAPRWTSINLSVFEQHHPLALPYYHDDMCKFICTVPEELLAKRQIQIEYIKMRSPELAQIPWQSYAPCNLYNYKDFHKAEYQAKRAVKKVGRILSHKLTNKRFIQRNWELQFLGKDNDLLLQEYLFHNNSFKKIIPQGLVQELYKNFKEKDAVWHSHPISMLLTMSLFSKKHAQAERTRLQDNRGIAGKESFSGKT